MKALLLGSLLLISVGSISEATTTPSKKDESLSYEIQVGDKITRFHIKKTRGHSSFEASQSPNRTSKKGELSDENFVFLKKKFTEIQGLTSYSTASCPRQHVGAVVDGKKIESCLTAKNKTTQKLVELSQALRFLL